MVEQVLGPWALLLCRPPPAIHPSFLRSPGGGARIKGVWSCSAQHGVQAVCGWFRTGTERTVRLPVGGSWIPALWSLPSVLARGWWGGPVPALR